ncbi:hypothetical protein RHMOL_Rhmol07G0013800 [Rhododendron molle]|uniref:Uncharacterized protein n=1 Tax=Rhododendron molle TaxID=49168 RepID=A0ACC0MXP8_RHOML|nr:hypothetical protein RHMOL_Rhmol07G0013800 [Rhododendron molle]
MSLENEIQSSPDGAAVPFPESKKPSKLSYTRDFLLSISELDACKKLPSGFDASVLSEFEDASYGIQDRQRVPGSSPLLSYRRTEYSSSPPFKGDSSNYSRGTYGKWDSYSSGRIEKDSDTKSDWDSDSGRHHFNQSRRSWQTPEHDGLLGSGSFPKPSGNAAGLSTPKVRPNDPHQLNRSNEPYHPPRPYKAVPHLRRGATDSFNDETFGSTECTSQDKAEEEKRRRESFELMRKEQQKVLQEKQNNPDKHKDGHVLDVNAWLEDTKDKKRISNRSNELEESMAQTVSNNDSWKSSSQILGSRPLVPPGFKSTISEKNSNARALNNSHSTEVTRIEFEQNLYDAKVIGQNETLDNQQERQSAQKMDFREQQPENTLHILSVDKGEQIVDSSAVLDVSLKRFGVEDQLYRTTSLSEACETQDGSESVEFDMQKFTGHKIIGSSKQDQSTTILQNLFGGASKVNLSGSSDFIKGADIAEHVNRLCSVVFWRLLRGVPNMKVHEVSSTCMHDDAKRDETRSSDVVNSSKFAQWFLEDAAEKAAVENPPQSRSTDLLSLIVGGEKGGPQVFDMKATDHIPPPLSFQSSELTNKQSASNMASSTIGISEHLYSFSKLEAPPAILTCEDLEQTILSEYSESNSTLHAPVQGWSSGAKTEEPKVVIDNLASQHLMSLLQRGPGLINNIDSPNLDSGSSGKLHVPGGAIVGSVTDNSREEKPEDLHQSGRSLTLETLFGSAFMKELQSVGAPVSVQKGSVGSARMDISGVLGDSFDIGSSRSNDENNVVRSSQKQQSNSDKIENWLGFNDAQVEVDPVNHQNVAVSNLGGFDAAVDIQLPEEESLITVGDPLSTLNSMFMSAANSTQGELLYSNKSLDMAEKLGTLNTVFKDERPMLIGQGGPPFVRGPYDSVEPEIPYRNVHAQPSSPHFQSPHMNHGRPFLRPLDSYPNRVSSQMNFMAPEGILDHDASANHQFHANMARPRFPHPNSGPTGFDLPRHSMLQQMQMPGNFLPPHLVQEFPRGGLLTPHSNNDSTGFTQALNQTQALPFGHQQPNYGGFGMRLQAPDVSGGSNHPEAFQRLLEMELRANSRKTTHPFPAVGRNQGMYGGQDLDMGFRYR